MKVLLGIELGEKILKIAVGKRHGMVVKPHDYIIGTVDSLAEGDISKVIIEKLKKGKYRSGSVKVSLPRNYVTVRGLHLPSRDEKEIEKMIGFHITRIVPHKIDEVVYSYCRCGTDEKGNERVALAIAQNVIVNRQLKILDKAGLLVDRITLSSYYAWQRIVKDHNLRIKQGDLAIVLDVDYDFTDFIIFEKDNFLFSRSIAVKAEQIKTEFGLKQLLGEVRQSLLVFQNEEINKKPQRIFLSGAVSESLKTVIEEELEMPVKYVPSPVFIKKGVPPENVSLNALAQLIVQPDNTKNLSFILPEIEIRKSLRERIVRLVVLGSLLIYFLGMVCLAFLSRIYNQQAYLQKLEGRYSQIERNIGDLALQLEKIEFAQEYIHSRRSKLYVLYQLQKIMPGSMGLNFIQIDAEGRSTIRGQVFQLSEVFDFMNALEQVEHFGDVQTKYTRKGRWQDREVTDFEISFQLDKE